MKKAALLLLLALPCAALLAQLPPTVFLPQAAEHPLPPPFPNKKKAELAARNGEFYVVDSLYCYATDPATQLATPVSRQYNVEFDEQGASLYSFTQQFLPSGEWRNVNATHYTYDGNGNLIEQRVETWDTLAQAWLNQLLTLNTPNENGDFTLTLNQEWHNSNWRNRDRVIVSFDQNNLLQSLEQELWDTLGGAWRNNFIIYYAVNPNGTIASTLFQIWDATAGGFKNISATFLSYDPDHPEWETEQVARTWDAANSEWLNSSRSTKGYDPEGNLTEQTVQYWNTLDSSWLNQGRTLQNFNTADQVTLRTELLWNGSQWENWFQTNYVYDPNDNLTHFEVSQWDGDGWQSLSECIFFWRFHHEVPTVEVLPAVPCLFPNPLRSGDALQCPYLPTDETFRLALFDFQGKMTFSQNIDHQSFANIGLSLPAGLYVLTLSGENGVIFSQKVVILE